MNQESSASVWARARPGGNTEEVGDSALSGPVLARVREGEALDELIVLRCGLDLLDAPPEVFAVVERAEQREYRRPGALIAAPSFALTTVGLGAARAIRAACLMSAENAALEGDDLSREARGVRFKAHDGALSALSPRRRTPGPLRLRRLTLGLTQADLAGLAGVSREQISRIETGRSGPLMATAARLADALGLAANELFPEKSEAAGGTGARGKQGLA